MKHRLWTAVPLIIVTFLYLLHNLPLLTMQGLPLGGDGLLFFYPAEFALARALSSGSLPFWVPELQAGFPLFADGQPGGVYPFNLLAFGLLPTPLAHNLILVLHGFLGLLFVYAWGRLLKISQTATALMGFVFVMTTPLVGANVAYLETLTWLPLLFIITEYAVQRGNPRLLWPLALVVALQWLAGFPQIAFYSLVANVVYLVGRVYCEPLSWRKQAGFLLLWGSAVILGMLLAAPQWLPTYELAGHSIRAEGIQGSMVGEKSLFPVALLTFVLQSWRDFFAQAGLGAGEYVGILPFLMALTAAFVRPQRKLLYPLLALVIITTILALGRYNPAFFIVRQLPGFSSFRAPSRFLIPAAFGIITLFGLGWDTLFSAKQPQAEKWFGRFLKIAILLFLASSVVGYTLLVRFQAQIMAMAETFTRRFILGDQYHLQSLAFYQAKIERLYTLLLEATGWYQLAVFIPFLVVTVGFVFWRLWRKEPTRFRYVPALWFALIILDILLFAGGWRATEPITLVTQPPTAVQIIQAAPKPQEMCRIFWLVDEESVNFQPENLELLPANYQLIFGLASTGVYSPLGFHHYYRLTESVSNVNLAFGLRPLNPDDVFTQKPLLNLLNVCYLLSRQPLAGFPKIGQADEVGIYANEGVLPRAFVVDQAAVVSTNDEALAWVHEHSDELRETAVIESPLAEPLTPTAAQSAQVQIVSYTPLEIVIDVTTPGNVLLLLTDTDYPGWTATLDGEPEAASGRTVPICRANAAFKAVPISAGEHQIVFSFEPVTFKTGIALATVGLILLTLWVFWAYSATFAAKDGEADEQNAQANADT